MEGKTYTVMCCSGIAIDLLNSVARDLNFDYDLYLVADGLFGVPRNGGQWDGITADLVSGAAHITFSAFSVTSARVNVRARHHKRPVNSQMTYIIFLSSIDPGYRLFRPFLLLWCLLPCQISILGCSTVGILNPVQLSTVDCNICLSPCYCHCCGNLRMA